MKKILRISLIVIILGLFAYGGFVVEEVLRTSSSLRKPLIVFEEQYTSDEITYVSLGYTLKRKLYCKSDDLCIVNSEEYWLFDKILIWGWIN